MANPSDKSSGQDAAEEQVEEFREDLGPFVVAAETTRMPMVFTNANEPEHPIIFANQAFISMTGYSREEILAQNFDFMLSPKDDAKLRDQISAAFEDNSGKDPVLPFCRKDGSPFWATVFVSPVHDKGGAVVQHFASFVDCTSQKQEEARLRSLLDELNHRAQNTLATVQGIALQSLRGVDKQAVEAFSARILALAKAHSLLGSENWDAVSLRELLTKILAPFGLHNAGGPVFLIEGGTVRLAAKAALSLALVFHELAANAAKHGAHAKGCAGEVRISWEIEQAERGAKLRLRWRETGGPPAAKRGPRGFGSRLIEGGLAQDLNGEVNVVYPASGLDCEIIMPLSQVAERE